MQRAISCGERPTSRSDSDPKGLGPGRTDSSRRSSGTSRSSSTERTPTSRVAARRANRRRSPVTTSWSTPRATRRRRGVPARSAERTWCSRFRACSCPPPPSRRVWGSVSSRGVPRNGSDSCVLCPPRSRAGRDGSSSTRICAAFRAFTWWRMRSPQCFERGGDVLRVRVPTQGDREIRSKRGIHVPLRFHGHGAHRRSSSRNASAMGTSQPERPITTPS